MKPHLHAPPPSSAAPKRLASAAALLALSALLAGCSIYNNIFGDSNDYKNAVKTQPLEVPPDLSQLQRDSRYQPQGGVVSASTSGAAAGPSANGAAAGPAVAVNAQAGMRLERDGQSRWLVSPLTPEQLWPQLRAFWAQNGFTLASEDPAVGVMETNWAESGARLPTTGLRGTLLRIVGSLTDSGERDRFRVRVERTPAGSEVYIAHRGAEEVYTDERHENTSWVPRPNNPQLEAEFLSRLMLALGPRAEAPPRRAATTTTTGPATARVPEPTQRPSIATANTATSLTIDEPFDRAWRRVGLALDRGGFTVEDRDRAAGLYYVRYVDPKYAGEDPAWWQKIFNATNPQAPQRLRIVLKPNGDKTSLAVQNSTGTADVGDNAKRIVGLLMTELR